MKKFICKSCGWEIINAQWWNIAKDYEGNYLCDDCEMNRDYRCLDCGLTYYLSLGRIKEDKPNALSFVCEVCQDI